VRWVSATSIALVVCVCVLAGALFGSLLRSMLPAHHLSDESKDVVRVATGLVATLVALVLGLLVASAKTSFDTKSQEITDSAVKVVLLDRELRRLGPAGEPVRASLRAGIAVRLSQPWDERRLRSLGDEHGPMPSLTDVEVRLRDLVPANNSERWLQSRALALTAELGQTRWLLSEQAGSAIALPFLVIVVFWLFFIFTSLGMFAPPNLTVYVAIVLCAISVSAAVLLILELDRPFEGLISISKEPLRDALRHLEERH